MFCTLNVPTKAMCNDDSILQDVINVAVSAGKTNLISKQYMLSIRHTCIGKYFAMTSACTYLITVLIYER